MFFEFLLLSQAPVAVNADVTVSPPPSPIKGEEKFCAPFKRERNFRVFVKGKQGFGLFPLKNYASRLTVLNAMSSAPCAL